MKTNYQQSNIEFLNDQNRKCTYVKNVSGIELGANFYKNYNNKENLLDYQKS